MKMRPTYLGNRLNLKTANMEGYYGLQTFN